MASLVEELSAQARTLPPADRVRLAEELLATVHEPDDEIDAACSASAELMRVQFHEAAMAEFASGSDA